MPSTAAASGDANRLYLHGLVRAFGGALLFSLPLLMTMEMWWLGGFTMERERLLIFLVASLPMLLGLSYYVGFQPTFCLTDEILDALAAFAVGFLLSTTALTLLGVIGPGLSLADTVGKIALCTIPASIGALLAGKQLGMQGIERQRRTGDVIGPLFLMAVGAVFLAFNVAPTEEMIVISYMIGPIRTLLLMAASVLALHGFVYALGFPGQDRRRAPGGFRQAFLVYTLPGYAIALAISAYCLWTFGRFDGVALHEQATMTVVLGFPAALGAATARLVT